MSAPEISEKEAHDASHIEKVHHSTASDAVTSEPDEEEKFRPSVGLILAITVSQKILLRSRR
jgi:hypothetical protein